MKKTITLLAALLATGLSWGEEDLSLETVSYELTDVIDFGRADSQTSSAVNITTSSTSASLKNLTGTCSLTFDYVGGNADTPKQFTETIQNEGNGPWKEAFTGSLPTGFEGKLGDGLIGKTTRTGNKDTVWGMKLIYTITFRGLDAGTYSLSGFGAYNGKDNIAGSVYIGLDGSTTPVGYTGQTYNTTNGWVDTTLTDGTDYFAGKQHLLLEKNNGANNKGYAFGVDNITVGENGEFTLTLIGHADTWENMPLNAIKLVGVVPEPATATLSLLALAGLAARRRRK